MSSPPDQPARDAAVDPARSFIVQAPAGSGKTELLIQRYLALLPTVARPEQVVALTFSRKAAAEMARRVVSAVQRAADDTPPPEPHVHRTWELARAVAAHGRDLGWELGHHPGRLRIQTLDALSLELARRLPLLARLGDDPRPTEQAAPLYREAARRTLDLLDDGGVHGAAVARLLGHLDGRPDRFIELLADLLARRDQWVVRLGEGELSGAAARARLEVVLGRVVVGQLREVRSGLPAAVAEQLHHLAGYAADNLVVAGSPSPITALAGSGALPGAGAADLAAWRGVAELLLTRDGAVRKPGGVNKTLGFPPGKPDSAEVQAKGEMQALLQGLAGHERWCARLHQVRTLPDPAYDDRQWQVVEALVAVLWAAVAQLWLVCREAGEVDFPGVALQALHALGQADDPSDLLLALDQEIHHLLVDEFQDTSRRQWELVERLTAGWEAGDGRTLFVVGDPMQSIYRFREAEVGLFLQARRQGIGQLNLTPLVLTCNFRSRAGVVDWVNATFAPLFPPTEEEATGAVGYAQFQLPGGDRSGGEVHLHPQVGRDDAAEAAAVVALCRAARERGERCAILAHGRSHLLAILPALVAAGLAYRAEALLPLAERPVVEDLYSITRALLHPFDRIAWLAVLRAPWAGLDLADLDALCGDAPQAAIPALLADPERVARLSAAGRDAAVRVQGVMARAAAEIGRRPLRARVEGAWVALGGAAAIAPAEAGAVDAYLALVDRLEQTRPVDADRIATTLADLHAPPDATVDASLSVMTIHKAKGLEFDTVILPGLGRRLRGPEAPLLRWFDHPEGLLVAPRRPSGGDDAIYDYIAGLERQAEQHEALRLLYVAATRTRCRLHLLGHVTEQGDGEIAPGANTPLARLWPAVEAAYRDASYAATAPAAPPVRPPAPPPLRRLVDFHLPAAAPPLTPAAAVGESPTPPFRWAGDQARQVGEVAHLWLRRIAEEGVDRWSADRLEACRPQLRAALAAGGAEPGEIEAAIERVVAVLRAALADERGQWLLARHDEAACELPLAGVVEGRTVHYVLDRTFVDEHSTRWIVDYKSSTHEGGDVDAFLAAEWDRYRPQLERYARLMARLDDRPIRIALYHPALSGWREASVGE